MYFKQSIGKLGEDIACLYLEKNNYKIIKRNFRCKQGELDIIAFNLKKELIKEIGNHFIIKYYPIVSVRTFKLMADYDSLLLRDIEYPFSIEFNKLPISENLIKRLENWDVAYVATLNQEYPPLSDFPTPEERKKFMEEGYALHRLLQEALKDTFVIEYEPLPEKEDV